MKYDIAAKRIVDIGKEQILKEFFGIESDNIQLLEELPEKTVSIRRSDFPLRIVSKDGHEKIVVLEIQTEFNKDFVLRLIDYTVRFMLKYHLEVTPLALLLTPTNLATGIYEDDRLRFRYEVARLWEKQARDYTSKIFIYPFLPLMNGGEKLIEQIDTEIYENDNLSMDYKADLLTATAIFAGLKDKKLGTWLIERRRDIMIQSPVYDFIEEEGIKKGIIIGKKEGIEEGKKEGLHNAVSLGLEIKFGIDGIALLQKVNKIESIEKLEAIIEAIKITNKIEEIEKLI